ncbi:hypothetical protein IWX50DRAFT_137832 [Phyllosticta citricarpa]
MLCRPSSPVQSSPVGRGSMATTPHASPTYMYPGVRPPPGPWPMPTCTHAKMPACLLPTIERGRLFRLREACGVRDISTLCIHRVLSCPVLSSFSRLFLSLPPVVVGVSLLLLDHCICSALASPQTHSRRPALAHAAQLTSATRQTFDSSIFLFNSNVAPCGVCFLSPSSLLSTSFAPLQSLARLTVRLPGRPLRCPCTTTTTSTTTTTTTDPSSSSRRRRRPPVPSLSLRLVSVLRLALEGTTSLVLKTSSDLHPKASPGHLAHCTLNLPPVVPAFFFRVFLPPSHPHCPTTWLPSPARHRHRERKKKKKKKKKKYPPVCPATPPPVSKAGSLAPASSVCASSLLASIPTSSAAAFF